MAENYVLLETIELTQSAASVTFDNLPTSGYTDLKVVCSIRSSRTSSTDGAHFTLRFNGNSSSIYSFKHIRGTGTAASSYGETNANSLNLYSQASSSSDTANTFSSNEIYIPNYLSGTSKSLSVDSVYENNATAAGQHLVAGLWASNDAITSIIITEGTGNNFVQYSTFSLYGVAALGTTPVLAPQATGGNIVANDGTYWYHAFLSSGNFVPQTPLTCDILQIAGGGGGGSWTGGGGGAGGLLAYTSQSLTVQNYPVTVGAGGAGGSYAGPSGARGSNSQFDVLTASTGGGGAGGYNGAYFLPLTGGSGGGGTTDQTGDVGAYNGAGASPSGQGNAGGSYDRSLTYAAGGGGGAGAVGGNNSGTTAGSGGIGIATYSSWGLATTTGQNSSGTVYYAGGGGGGSNNSGSQSTGGLGGGGAGRVSFGQTPDNGTAGTGGGGGGGPSGSGGTAATGGTGGSGIVIIRYAMV
jgi:hypothetical protein